MTLWQSQLLAKWNPYCVPCYQQLHCPSPRNILLWQTGSAATSQIIPVSLTVRDKASDLKSAHESATEMDAARLILFESTSIINRPNKEFVQGCGGYLSGK